MAVVLRQIFARKLLRKHLNCLNYATKAEKKKGIDRKVPPKINSTAESIAARGFLRPQKNYTPPSDIDQKITEIFQKIIGNTDLNTKITDINQRFKLFTKCEQEFSHCIPNSLLCKMECLGDVKQFYKTLVDIRTPLDKMRSMDLPENLHVQFEYHRFHPETDTMFGGQTAFNRSSTIVTGLKYRDKYKGHVQNTTWPFNS